MKTIKVLSLPSRHPYTSKFNTNGIEFVNPNTDLFGFGGCNPNYLNERYPASTYDVVHIHISFDRLSLEELEIALKYFKANKKPVIWTLHSKECQRIRNYGEGKYQKLMYAYADRIISPTNGAVQWLKENIGSFKHPIPVIPLGFMADPRDIKRLQVKVKKDPALFTMLIGEFRQNKEFLQSVVNFLQCSDLRDFKLQLIFKPIALYADSGKISEEMTFFYHLMQHPRVEILSKPEISNDELNAAFLQSHAIILSYRWGTHSGQLEQAKDCGCHVVVSNVGFYKEQWDQAVLYDVNEKNSLETARRYTNALIEVAQRPSLQPAGMQRLDELHKAIEQHIAVYTGVMEEFANIKES